jgi:hypothetical protein
MQVLTVYHGSTICIEKPCLLPANRRLDFGPGFYTTTDLAQAQRWAQIKKRRMMTPDGRVSVYAFDMANPVMKVKTFDAPDEEWLDFVMANRMRDWPAGTQHDVIAGPVANDTLYQTLSLFERGILNRQETITRLRTHALANQVVFCTEAALSSLQYKGCLEVAS